MKYKIFLSAALAAMVGMTSCEEDIDILPVENNTSDQFYKSEEQMQQAIVGIYAGLGRYGSNEDYPTLMNFIASESRSDNLFTADIPNAQRDQQDIRNFLCTPTTGFNQTIYARLYSIIANANTLLAKSSESMTRYRAEARFMRALAYFDLVRAYGPQPICDHIVERAEAKDMPRQSEAECYKLIVEDLKAAAEGLDDFYTGKEAGRVGAVAAKTLLAYVYVTMAGYPVNDSQGYANAASVLQPIMSKVDTRWAADFKDVFSIDHENQYDIFSVQFESGNKGLGSSMPAYCTVGQSASSVMPEWTYWTQQGQNLQVDQRLVDAMKAEGDKRFESTVIEGFWDVLDHGTTAADTATNWRSRNVIIKYFVKDATQNRIKNWNDHPLNIPLLRPADAYLLYAEALVNTGKANEAKPYINKVRQRAGLADLATVSQEDVLNERRREFLGEGKRYFDLVRMGEQTFINTLKEFSDHYELVKKMGAQAPSKKDMLLPIPLVVMNINMDWQQNPGY